MSNNEIPNMVEEALNGFCFSGRVRSCSPHGNGHINDTYMVECRGQNDDVERYILQRINHHVFKQPLEVNENIARVTAFLQDKIAKTGGNPERETLSILLTKDGESTLIDRKGNYWRAFRFIEQAFSVEQVDNPQQFYESAYAFGHFQQLLSDFPAHELNETIPDFHNTPLRYQTFQRIIKEDPCGRVSDVMEEIAFVSQRAGFMSTLQDAFEKGELPLRVTHNDTKLNNVMLDRETGKALCVIDLDTVMPGFSVNDFGDSIRFGASTASEDEKDLDRVLLDLELYKLYTEGFLAGCGGSLTDKELDLLPAGAKMMTLECGMRFLTDYLQGDTYFRIHYPTQNLDRCRTQLKLVKEMEQYWGQMQEIVRNC